MEGPHWLKSLLKHSNRDPGESYHLWFSRIADCLLNQTDYLIAGKWHRPVEVEFYYRGVDHPDPFTHSESVQVHRGRWYFHRSSGAYRGGSFKGHDVTFGHGEATGGILFRAMEAADGTLIDGPSLCVDHLLRLTGMPTVAALDKNIDERLAWDPANPLNLVPAHVPRQQAVYVTPRVGLLLKRAKTYAEMPRFVMLPYRFLTEPRRISKGRLHLVLSLHARGISAEEIHRITGATRQSIARYVTEFEAGRKEREFTPYFGKDLSPAALCRLTGLWHATAWGRFPNRLPNLPEVSG